MNIELTVLHKSETLLGIRFSIVRFLQNESEIESFSENRESFPKGYVIEIGAVFFKLTLTLH
jgi:hypothetical protein